MKRFAIIMAALLLAVPSFAQLNITAQSKGLRQEMKMPSYRTTLYRDLNDGALAVAIPTDNRFDDRVWLRLGGDNAEAVATCRELLDMLETMKVGECFAATQEEERLSFHRDRLMGADYFNVRASGRAGSARLYGKVLQKIIKYLEE